MKPIKKVKKILVRGTNWIGDAVMTLPAIGLLAQNLKDVSIHVATRAWACPVYECCPHVKRVFSLRSKGGIKGIREFLGDLKTLSGESYDLGIVLPNSFEAALLFRLTKIDVVAGYASDMRSLLLHQAIDVPADKHLRHEINYYAGLISKIISAPIPDESSLSIPFEIPVDIKKGVLNNLYSIGYRDGDILVGFNPGAAYGPAKCWPVERYKKLALRLVENYEKVKIVIFGTSNDILTGNEIKSVAQDHIINLCGQTNLLEAIAVISHLKLMVTNDSGLMHIAAACRIPMVAIFGSTNPVTTGPWSDKALIVKKSLSCAPCLKRSCPSNFECMLQIGVDEVFKACKSQMNKWVFN